MKKIIFISLITSLVLLSIVCARDLLNPMPTFEYQDFFEEQNVLESIVLSTHENIYDIIISDSYLGIIENDLHVSLTVYDNDFSVVIDKFELNIDIESAQSIEFYFDEDKLFIFSVYTDYILMSSLEISTLEVNTIFQLDDINYSAYTLSYIDVFNDTLYFGIKSSTIVQSSPYNSIYEILFVKIDHEGNQQIEKKSQQNNDGYQLDLYRYYFVEGKIYGVNCKNECQIIQLIDHTKFIVFEIGMNTSNRDFQIFADMNTLKILRFDVNNDRRIHLDVLNNEGGYQSSILLDDYYTDKYTSYKVYGTNILMHYKIYGIRLEDVYGNAFCTVTIIDSNGKISYYITEKINTIGNVWFFGGKIMGHNIKTNEILLFEIAD